MRYPKACRRCPTRGVEVSKHIELWEKALIKALRQGEFCAAQFAEAQLDKYQEMLCEIEKATASAYHSTSDR